MKRTIFVFVSMVLFIALLGGTAFAQRYNSGYTTPTVGQNPHGNFGTATHKCPVCHAVHAPGLISGQLPTNQANEAVRNNPAVLNGSQVLLRDTIANACTYCHIANPGIAIQKVYGANSLNYTSAFTNAHSTNGLALNDGGVNCTDCHQVHGAVSNMVQVAGTPEAYMYYRILKTTAVYDPDAPAMLANASTSSVIQSNMTTWCTRCHTYYEATNNSNSHVMTIPIATFGTHNPAAGTNGRVAWASSADCRSCHQAGGVNGATSTVNFPHYVAGSYRFLLEATSSMGATANANIATNGDDGMCLICHVQQAGLGVGQGF